MASREWSGIQVSAPNCKDRKVWRTDLSERACLHERAMTEKICARLDETVAEEPDGAQTQLGGRSEGSGRRKRRTVDRWQALHSGNAHSRRFCTDKGPESRSVGESYLPAGGQKF